MFKKILKGIIQGLFYLVKPQHISKKTSYSVREQTIFNTLLLSGFFLSVIFCFFNYIELQDTLLAVTTLTSSIFFFILYFYSKYQNYQNVWLTLFVITILLSILWFMNGGLIGSTTYIYILSLFLIVILAKPHQQDIMFLIFIANILGLLVIEYFCSSTLIRPYTSTQGYYTDIGFTFLLVLVAVFFLMRFFKRLYEAEKSIVEQQKVIIEQQNREYLSSLRYASNLQRMIISAEEELQYLFDDYFVLFKPKDIVSGDFYWVKQKGEYGIVVVADCTGHGVPAAFLSILGISLLDETIQQSQNELKASEFLEALRLKFIVYTQKHNSSLESIKDSIDLGILIVSYKESTIQFAGANRSLLMISNKKSELHNTELKTDSSETHNLFTYPGTKNTIGYNMRELAFKNHTIPFLAGDAFYMFSDGYGDQFDASNKKKYKVGSLKKELLKIHNMPMQTQASYLETVHQMWRGATEQTDDILIIGIKI
jgi:serine phosphatase RsbU (regulator of sigma subunit)